MRPLALLVLIGVVWGHAATARADRSSDLEAWLRRERVVSVTANRHTLVVERVGAILVCARAHEGEPVCVIERNPTVHDVFVTYDSFHEDGTFHYCVSWIEADGERQWARWDRRAPGTHGPCVEDYNVFGTRREAGLDGRFATLTSERVPLYASLDHHATPAHIEGMAGLADDEALCLEAPRGWTCTASRAFLRALSADRLAVVTPWEGDLFFVHAIEVGSHTWFHSVAMVSFAQDDLVVLDRIAIGGGFGAGADPGPHLVPEVRGRRLVLTPRGPDVVDPRAGEWTFEDGHFVRAPTR